MRDDYAPCLKCKAPTSNKWQLCKPCRAVKCVRCKHVFNPREHGEVKCGFCKNGRKRKGKS